MEHHNFNLDEFLFRAIEEDVGEGDHTSLATIPESVMGKAHLLVKDEGMLCGMLVARRVFELVDQRLTWEPILEEGSIVHHGDIAFRVSGPSRSITTAERLALNILQRMSGIATRTYHLNGMIRHTGCRLLDTRKTTPGFRYFEKLAVHRGGGVNHRFGLYDMILVKDNHIDYAGGVIPALQLVHDYLASTGLRLKVEAEARNLKEVEEILQAGGVFRILLDNFEPALLREAVKAIGGRVEAEASGGITEENIVEYAETGVNYISMGALTHQVRSLDMSLKAVK